MAVAVVFPWRENGPERKAAKAKVEQTFRTILPDVQFYDADSGHKKFNRAASRNTGVRLAEADGHDKVIVCDADTEPEREPLLEALKACTDGLLHLPYDNCRLLAADGYTYDETDISVGGTWVMTVEAWNRVGGSDERFTGWGYEDNSFYTACKTLLGEPVRHKGTIKCHWHPSDINHGTKEYNDARALYLTQEALADDPQLFEKFYRGNARSSEVLAPGRGKRVAVVVHNAIPHLRAGSEIMLHEMLHALTKRGHEIQVFVTEAGKTPEVVSQDGIRVLKTQSEHVPGLVTQFKPHLILTHHQCTDLAQKVATQIRVPWGLLLHNQLSHSSKTLRLKPDIVVSNSEWILKSPEVKPLIEKTTSVVVHPPVFPKDHETTPGKHITIVNLDEIKGPEIFWEVAKRLPDYKFLAVTGGYGSQRRQSRRNVTNVAHTDDMKADVWSKTALLLMPSKYESYGMAAVEAACSGIPTVAAPTPGLIEALGYSGSFVSRDNLEAWVSTVKALMEPSNYKHASQLAYNYAHNLDPVSELKQWVSKAEHLMSRIRS